MHGKQIVAESPDFTLYVERAFGYPWAHCDVRRWAPSVKRALVGALDRVGLLLALIDPPGNEKLRHFVEVLGFRPLRQIDCLDGCDRQVYVRDQSWAG